jgi:hypothetical protein
VNACRSEIRLPAINSNFNRLVAWYIQALLFVGFTLTPETYATIYRVSDFRFYLIRVNWRCDKVPRPYWTIHYQKYTLRGKAMPLMDRDGAFLSCRDQGGTNRAVSTGRMTGLYIFLPVNRVTRVTSTICWKARIRSGQRGWTGIRLSSRDKDVVLEGADVKG